MGTHLKVLIESYSINTNMTGFIYFSKIFVLRTKVASALELCLTHWHSERPKHAWLFCWYFPHKSVFIKNIWRRNVYQNITNNSPSNISWEFALFPSYFQKYENGRQYFPGELLSVNGLMVSVVICLAGLRRPMWRSWRRGSSSRASSRSRSAWSRPTRASGPTWCSTCSTAAHSTPSSTWYGNATETNTLPMKERKKYIKFFFE